MGRILEACAVRPEEASQDAEDAEAFPAEALQLVLYTLSNDGSVRVRRAAMAVLKQANATHQ